MTRLRLMQFSLLPGFLLGLMSCADASLSSQQQADSEFRIHPDLRSQKQADLEFRIEVGEPAFGPEKGPPVCVDEAHNNVHTAGGKYKPFADLLREDGYRVDGFSSRFSGDTLTRCALLVIANALSGEDNLETRAFPHPSPFTRLELEALVTWIRKGGSLLLVADHAPAPGAARDLGALLGVAMFDGYARGTGEFPDLFEREKGTLLDHPISRGRNSEERVETVATFGGQAFQVSQHFQPLLVFAEGSAAQFHVGYNLPDIPRQEWPRVQIGGWAQGAVREWDSGRIVVLGEAAMCTAQLRGAERDPVGMNHRQAGENAQFCLNVVRWLTRVFL